MKKSVVYSMLLIAVIALSFTALMPHVSAQIQNVKILTHSWYIDSLGLLVCVGEVQNTGPNYISQVILGGNAKGSDGTSVDAVGTPAFVRYLAPNQKAPFYMEFYDQNTGSGGVWPSSDVSDISLEVIDATPTQNYSYPDIAVQSSNGAVDSTGAYMVNGVLKNTGSQTATGIVVVGTFYNSAGTVVATGMSDTENPVTLSPQGTANFKLGAWDLNQTIIPAAQRVSSYNLLIWLISPILQTDKPIITPDPSIPQVTATPTDQTSDPSSQGQPEPTGFMPGDQTSNSGDLTTAIIVGVVVAVVIVLFAFVLLRRRRKSQSGQETEQERRQPKKQSKRDRRWQR